MSRTSKLSTAVGLSILLSLSACHDEPPFNFAVQDVKPSPTVLPDDLRSITVTLAHPEEKTGPLPPHSDLIVAPMKEALTDAIDHSAIFRDDGQNHVNLSATVLKLDLPSFGFTMETDMDCRYSLIDRATGNTVFSTVIASKGQVPMDYAFVGAIRAKEAINRAVQNNISGFLQEIEASPASQRRTVRLQPPVSNIPIATTPAS